MFGLVFGFWFLVFGFWFLVFGFWFLVVADTEWEKTVPFDNDLLSLDEKLLIAVKIQE
eukprot:Pgem_evm1s16305